MVVHLLLSSHGMANGSAAMVWRMVQLPWFGGWFSCHGMADGSAAMVWRMVAVWCAFSLPSIALFCLALASAIMTITHHKLS